MIPLYTTSQVREADNYAINKLDIPSIALMENASRSIYSVFLENYPELTTEDEIAILCGKGNNGGDGFALARHFVNDGFKVKVLYIGKQSELSGDAKINYEILKKLSKKKSSLTVNSYQSQKDIRALKNSFAFFDALLGTGAKGELREPYKTIVNTVNEFLGYRIAIDSPTGLDLDKGTGEIVFNADLTITLAEYKSGLFFGAGYANAGQVEKGYIGIGDEYFSDLSVKDYLIEPEDAFLGLPIKSISSHKYSSGKVLSIAGSGKLPGAACLTANSVLNGGAGASILAFPKSIKAVAQKLLNSAIVSAYDDEKSEILKEDNFEEIKSLVDWADAVAIGPGLGREEETQNAVVKLINSFKKKKFVIDADAVFALSNGRYKKVDLRNKVLTPHHGEFSNLIGISTAELKNDLLKRGREFVKETGVYLVLKDAPTIIFTPEGDALINSSGNAGMATFGTGDVLTGLITSFVAQNDELENAVTSAVYIHSLAADLLIEEFTEHGITAESIMNNIPKAIKFIDDSFTKNYL